MNVWTRSRRRGRTPARSGPVDAAAAAAAAAAARQHFGGKTLDQYYRPAWKIKKSRKKKK